MSNHEQSRALSRPTRSPHAVGVLGEGAAASSATDCLAIFPSCVPSRFVMANECLRWRAVLGAAAQRQQRAFARALRHRWDKAAAEELRRRATALGLLEALTVVNVADDAMLKKAIAWCDEQGVTSVSDMVEYDMVDDFVGHLGLKTLPSRKLCSMLQAPTSKLASDRLASPSSSSSRPSPEKRGEQLGQRNEGAPSDNRSLLRLPPAASMINQGAPWDFFMSHVQRESGRAVALITMDLTMAGKKVWLDVNMDDCGTPAMMEGVEHSKTFMLVLSDGYFDSKYCVMELRRAISLQKKIVLCHMQGVNVGAILQRKPPDPEFANIGDKQSVELIVSDAKFRKVAVERLIASA